MGTLKITIGDSMGDMNDYVGLACSMELLLNSHIEIKVGCPMGWTMEELPEILAKSFPEKPITVHMVNIEYDKSIMN